MVPTNRVPSYRSFSTDTRTDLSTLRAIFQPVQISLRRQFQFVTQLYEPRRAIPSVGILANAQSVAISSLLLTLAISGDRAIAIRRDCATFLVTVPFHRVIVDLPLFLGRSRATLRRVHAITSPFDALRVEMLRQKSFCSLVRKRKFHRRRIESEQPGWK